jgi:beta-N-acetylhexosaminidase
MRNRLAILLLIIVLAACGGSPAAQTSPSPQDESPAPTDSPPDEVGPGGMTLDEEIGAVMMVGFQGRPTASILADWKQRQFGGLLIVNLNHNATTAKDMGAVIQQIRDISRHRLVAATDQEGGQVCIALSSVPCAAMPVGRSETAAMANALRTIGFDLDLGPVSDVCSGPASIMWGRCYGTSPGAVAGSVGAVVDGIHDANMLSAAKHFPGHGDTSISSETRLPRIDESLATLRARDFPPFRAAVAHGTDFVLLGHLFYPAIDAHRSADLSPTTVNLLRSEVGFKGAILSDDMEMGAITTSTPTPEAAVQFLIAGGDMVMVAHHISVADATYDAIKQAVLSGRLPRARLDEAVVRLQALPGG